MPQRIYLDNNASTLLDPRVNEFIVHTLPKLTGNPSSIHSYGRSVRGLVTKARDSIAKFLGVSPNELVFTSGGTESVHLVLNGIGGRSGHVITSAAEHACVIAACKQLQASGFDVTFLSPGPWGAVTPDTVRASIRPDTRLIALMAVNNETGVKTDIPAIAKIAKEHQIPFFVDAIAQLGKEEIQIPPGVSAVAFSGHKIHALQGIGLTFLRKGFKLPSIGKQEFGRRPGTENVLGILSMAKAIELLQEEPNSIEKMQQLRIHFENTLMKNLPGLSINGEGPRTSNVSNLSFPGIDGESFLMNLDHAGIAASHGSACSSGALEPSRVLLSMGLPIERVRSSIRFSLSRQTTAEEIDFACEAIIRLLLKRKDALKFD